jgi:hypothetical protein
MSNFVAFQLYVDPAHAGGNAQTTFIYINADHVTQIGDLGDHCGIEKDNGRLAEVVGTAAQALEKFKAAS